MPERKPKTWESVYYAAIRRGDDPAYALFVADQWKERAARRNAKLAADGRDHSARAVLARLPVIHDPVISEAMQALEEEDAK